LNREIKSQLLYFSVSILVILPTPVAARSNAWFCGRWLAGIVGLNPAGDMVVCCQVKVSASGIPLVQRSPTKCDVSE